MNHRVVSFLLPQPWRRTEYQPGKVALPSAGSCAGASSLIMSTVLPKKPECGFPVARQAPINRALNSGFTGAKPVASWPYISDDSDELSPTEISFRVPPKRT